MLQTYVVLCGAIKDLMDEADGASLVEYGLIVALVAIVVMVAVANLPIGNVFNEIGDRLRGATGGPLLSS